jgi:GH35 family endo-1,4-beta-xylanase
MCIVSTHKQLIVLFPARNFLDLQKQCAPVGGIRIQSYINSLIGHIVCSLLDKLSILGLPIWIAKLDL